MQLGSTVTMYQPQDEKETDPGRVRAPPSIASSPSAAEEAYEMVQKQHPPGARSISQTKQLQRLQKHRQKSGKNAQASGSASPFVLMLVLFCGLVILLSIIALFVLAPLFCASWLGILYVVWLFISTEANWRWHDAQEFENRFWTMMAFLFSTAVLYIKDSPLAIGQWNPSVGILLVFAFTLGVHIFDRVTHRREISRKPRLHKTTSHQSELYKFKATAEEKTGLVTECVESIDRIYLPSTFNNMFNLRAVIRQEQKIYRLLAGASRDELNYVLNHIKLALLFYKVKDHSRLPEDQKRSLILDLLCNKRLPDLTVTSRAIVLDALMIMKLSAHPMGEKWVRNILLRTSGDDLSRLKALTDAKGDFHSLHKLVFFDLRDTAIRKEVLTHIKREADVQTAHVRLGTRVGMERKQQAWRKVLSDVDDTLYSSGGRYPAGIDTRYPHHTLYPGVLAFYRELDMGTAGPDDWTDDRVGNLVFVSARPHVYKDVFEKKSYQKFAALYELEGMHTLPTLLAGSLKSGSAFMVQGDLEPMAQKKAENFGEYCQLYPEFTHVFIGDNGQGDVRAAELIYEEFGPNVLEAGFFHLVQPLEKTFGYHGKEDLDKWEKMNIFFFHTYVGGALKACQMGKLRVRGLHKIMLESARGFIAISTWQTPEDREKQRQLLNADLIQANEEIQKHDIAPVALLDKPQKFANGSDVSTPFGRGMVKKYRGLDGMYTLELLDWTGLRKKKRVKAYFTEEHLTPFVAGESASFPNARLSYVRFHRPPLTFILAANTKVKTPFGEGRVRDFRQYDEVYVVKMPSGCTAYVNFDAVVPVQPIPASEAPRMFAGVRSSLGYLTKKLGSFVPGSSSDKPMHSVGTTVETPFGRGIVIHFRPLDRIYQVQLLKSSADSPCVAYIVEAHVKEAAVSSPSRGLLSMLGLGGSSRPVTPKPEVQVQTEVSTPYGRGIVLRYRPRDRVYEVKLLSWTLSEGSQVRCYLTRDAVEEVLPPPLDLEELESAETKPTTAPPSGGLLQLLRYGFKGSSVAPSKKVMTPFGLGSTIETATTGNYVEVELDEGNLDGVKAYIQTRELAVPTTRSRSNTFELLGNPLQYLRWKSQSSAISGAFEPSIKPWFAVHSLVMTPFGEGLVLDFRTCDQMYTVYLDKMQAKGYFMEKSLDCTVRGVIGYPVDTVIGSGCLKEVRKTDGVHVVTYRNSSVTQFEVKAYLQPTAVRGKLTAACGDVVRTPFGLGVVVKFVSEKRVYQVALQWDQARRSHLLAYVQEKDVQVSGPVEKHPVSCLVM